MDDTEIIMPNEYLNKLNKLPPSVKYKLSAEEFLNQLDAVDEEFGIKSASLIVDILLQEIKTDGIADKLKRDYEFNDFLAQKIAARLTALASEAGAVPVATPKTGSEQLKKPAITTVMTFSREDEEEIKKYTETPLAPAKITDYVDAATSIILSFGYPTADEVMVKRLGAIVIARLKDVRDDLETKENLMKNRKVGGMEFPDGDAERLLKIIKSVASGQAVPENLGGASKELESILAEDEPEEPVAKPSVTASKSLTPTIEMEDGLPVIRLPDDLMVKPRDDSAVLEKKLGITPQAEKKLPTPEQDVKIKPVKDLPLPQPQPFIVEPAATSAFTPRPTSRPTLDDVKFSKKLMGPIEELENMTLIEFRRLSPNPSEVASKIKEKIDLLEKEHFGKKIEGIDAWHKSEISKFYRLLGQTAMAEGKSVEAVIQERLVAGKPTLSLDEFHAVMELNRTLRY